MDLRPYIGDSSVAAVNYQDPNANIQDPFLAQMPNAAQSAILGERNKAPNYAQLGTTQLLNSPQLGAVDLQTPANTDTINAANQNYQQIANQAGDMGQLQAAVNAQQGMAGQLAGQGGIQNQSNVFQQQQGLANQLQGIAQGQGPNPAQAMLAQNTGANVANQAALMAGQRGSSANAGLLARQAAQQGAATQQQAVGQGATMQAQQSLAALGQLQNQQQSMAGLASTQVGQQAQGNAQQAALANQITQNNLARQQMAAQQQQLQYGQLNTQNQQALGQQQGLNSIQAGLVGQQMQNQNQSQLQQQQQGSQMLGGLLQGAGTAAMMLLNQGGEVARQEPRQKYADGGPVSNVGRILAGGMQGMGDGMSNSLYKGASTAGQALGTGLARGIQALMPTSTPIADNAMDQVQQRSMLMGGNPMQGASLGNFNLSGSSTPGQSPSLGSFQYAKGGKVPALVSPGELYIPPNKVKAVADGKMSAHQAGKKIPGKAKVKGDSEKNDTVKANLDAGGIVVKRTAAKDSKRASDFVKAVLSRQGLKRSKK